MARMEIAPHVVEKILNHTTGIIGGVAAVYNRYGYDKEKRRALEAWESVVIGNLDLTNVIELHRAN
ncbi:MAG: hypothetical protein CBB68_04120 [Rhodospirillaceae bacterium TMED8]|nr:hypothetical protein [Magnetovibrio sp.]OUT51525.1 MAG: hypothetical protein CBB68_04120 [Rhodospirillaceae bacterium TMED8]